jgi:hypothetical protein
VSRTGIATQKRESAGRGTARDDTVPVLVM